MLRTMITILPWRIAVTCVLLVAVDLAALRPAGPPIASAALAGGPLERRDRQCFDETPYCLDQVFADYWNQNGGLPVFGFPIAPAEVWAKPDSGAPITIQWVERNRFELHPENAGTPYHMLLGLLGKQRLSQLGRRADPAEAGPQDGCLWFAETGHNVCDQEPGSGFMTYWREHGLQNPALDAYGRSLQLFGLPLTAPKLETNSSGDTVLTQWFERARFEWHPNNPPASRVLLGRLGSEMLSNTQSPGPPRTP